MRVCAVIPTFDRRDLLLETLEGLAKQSRPCDAIVVVDNASTDGSAEAVCTRYPDVEVLRFEHNSGSAGGFGAGISWALDHGFTWVWLIDNDSIPEPDALAELVRAFDRFDDGEKPVLLASKVVWTDRSILPLNVPIFKRKELDTFYLAAARSTLSVRAAPYAGVLVSADAVRQSGLPIPEYFLWNDDIEWTGRLLRDAFGVLVPASVLCHKTPSNPTTTADAGPRFYFEIRNKLWMCRASDAYRPMEKVRFLLTLVVDTTRHLRVTQPHHRALTTMVAGIWAGMSRRPPRPSRITAAAEPSE
ncbi:MAG: glycosyltransferase [Actinomycetota bacterium]|nr:glycosyltransferase [Actinomycetota bacterium]